VRSRGAASFDVADRPHAEPGNLGKLFLSQPYLSAPSAQPPPQRILTIRNRAHLTTPYSDISVTN
jgi:hypothetical protein